MQQARSPRVVVVSSRLDIGGTERHLTRVLPELRRRGIDISLFVMERGGRLEPQLIASGVPVAGSERRGSRFFNAVSAGWQLRKYVQQVRPDILHFFLAEPYLVGSLATSSAEIIRMMSRRSLSVYQTRHRFLALLERRLHARTAVLLGNSTAVVEELIRESGSQHRVGLIHSGIDVPERPTARQRSTIRRTLAIPSEAFVLLVVANLIRYKGHADLVCALALIKDVLPQPWRLVLVGRDQGIGDQLREDARKSGLTENLIWLNERTDPESLIDAADVGVLTSHEEGFSNSLLECMAREIPVIATAVGGNIDAVLQGQSGLLVPVAAPAALAEAILELAKDPVLRVRLGEGARNRVEELFSLDACATRYANLYGGAARLRNEPAQSIIEMSDNGKVAAEQDPIRPSHPQAGTRL